MCGTLHDSQCRWWAFDSWSSCIVKTSPRAAEAYSLSPLCETTKTGSFWTDGAAKATCRASKQMRRLAKYADSVMRIVVKVLRLSSEANRLWVCFWAKGACFFWEWSKSLLYELRGSTTESYPREKWDIIHANKVFSTVVHNVFEGHHTIREEFIDTIKPWGASVLIIRARNHPGIDAPLFFRSLHDEMSLSIMSCQVYRREKCIILIIRKSGTRFSR